MKTLFLFIGMFSIYGLGFTQNVGISTLNPAFKLDVRNGSINTDSVYRIGTKTVLSVEGNDNLFVGKNCGPFNTGFQNTFSGNLSGSVNTTGFSNSFFGMSAGFQNTEGHSNSFFGAYSGFYSTTGIDNCFFGTNAGTFNTTGNSNSFFGRSAGLFNTTGFSNSFYGTAAGLSNDTGSSNCFYGDSTGYQNTTGTDNTFMGKWAGYFNTIGNSNSFFGQSAGLDNSTGYSNSFFGQTAGYQNTSGFENASFGFSSGPVNTSGFENSFFGTYAGYQNLTGSKNSFFGKYAGYGNTSGTLNTAIGYSAFFNSGALTNATAIGNNARVDCSNCMVLGSVTNVNNAPSGVNVGIGVNSPHAKLSISSYGVDLAGSAASSLFRTNAGVLGSMANDEMSIANIGFASLNNSSFGITAYRRVPGSDWMSTSLLLEYDVDNTARVNSSFIALSANGNVGIATVQPQARLDVNGATKTNSLLITSGGNPTDFLIKNDAAGQVGFRKGHGGLGLNYIIAVAGAYPSQSPPQSQGPMIGEIKIFTGNNTPYGWLFCQGQLVLVADYPLLFSLIGTTYGGNGQTNFALPDLRGAVPVGEGTTWVLGEHSN